MKFDYIQDPGHGWIKIPIKMLEKLNILYSISPFSHIRLGFAYLEEDDDAGKFCKAYKEHFGNKMEFRSRVAWEKRSKVRSYPCYTPQAAEAYLKMCQGR